MVKAILIAGFGGFLGTIFRLLVTRYFQIHLVAVFPWATFTINILGSFLIGIFYGISEKGNLMSPEWRLFLTVGLCGGFTTYSSLSNDALLLLESKEMLRFVTYTSLTFFLGLLAVFLGRLIIKSL